MCELGQQLGSDVPFFLLGGTGVGIGRGSEVFPLPESPVGSEARRGVLVAPGMQVSTVEAYRRLSPHLTTESQQNKIFSFQAHTWKLGSEACPQNDFEAVVFEQHGRLATLKKKLMGAGASVALMSGSGSAVFGLFRTSDEVSRAIRLLGDETTFRISLVSGARYLRMWWRALEQHIDGRVWPPRSRNAR